MSDPTHEGDRAELAEGIDPRSLEEPLDPSMSNQDAEQVIEAAVAGVADTPIFGFENPPIPPAAPTYKDPVTGQTLTPPTPWQLFLDPASKRELVDPPTGNVVVFQFNVDGIVWGLWDRTTSPPQTPAYGWIPPVVTDGSPLLAPDLPDKDAGPVPPPAPVNPGSIRLARPEQGQTADQLLWTLIRNRTNAISFNNYFNFINSVLCGSEPGHGPKAPPNEFRFVMGELRNLGTNGFEVLKGATELFLQHEAGIIVNPIPGNTPQGQVQAQALQQMYDPMISPEGEVVRRNFDKLPADWVDQLRRSYYDNLTPNTPVLPYFTMILDRLQDLAPKGGDEIFTNCYGVLPGWVTGPLGIELIWSYWHEEGMLAQTFNAICNRFQNRRLSNNGGPDPLARLEIDPLRRLNHYIWAWIQNEPFRLSVRRRAFEYEHEYGLRLLGRAVGNIRGADVRSKFLEALHNLLYTSVIFHLQDDDLTVQADGFPVLNALRETQLVLTEGSHNQYGDLPWVARVEMLMELWMLGRPEMREFLGGRVMVPYIEPWMDRVDTVKSMLDWTPTNVTHFRDLGVFGEQVLLSVRYGTWAKEIRPEAAANWARYWRPEIQGYVHAYRAATGADLRQGVDANMPGTLLQRRLSAGPKPAALTR